MAADKNRAAVTITIPEQALMSIFDDCDRYDDDETGGRIIGVFRNSPEGALEIEVTGLIGAGPRARRSRSSFFQDGEYQAEEFQRIETAHPEIEHLGNWHTHHVNGFPTLSAGDIETYKRIVNHEAHNHHFFYALLVVSRSGSGRALSRYKIRHYLLYRGDDVVYEIESPNVVVTQAPLVCPIGEGNRPESRGREREDAVRAKDKAIMPVVFPSLSPYWSKRASTVYWKGPLKLIDSSSVEIMVPEMSASLEGESAHYQVIVKNAPEALMSECEEFALRQFDSAAQAVSTLEREMNRALYRTIGNTSRE